MEYFAPLRALNALAWRLPCSQAQSPSRRVAQTFGETASYPPYRSLGPVRIPKIDYYTHPDVRYNVDYVESTWG